MACEVDTRTLPTCQPHLLPFPPCLPLEPCASVILHIFSRCAVPSLICLPSPGPCLPNSSSTCTFEFQVSVWQVYTDPLPGTGLLSPSPFASISLGCKFSYTPLLECKISLRNKTIDRHHFTLRVWNVPDIQLMFVR